MEVVGDKEFEACPVREAAEMPSNGGRKVVIAVDLSNWAEMAFDCEWFSNQNQLDVHGVNKNLSFTLDNMRM